MNNIATTNLADFGYRERDELIKLLNSWNKYGICDEFSFEEVVPFFNLNTGNVFLTNNENQLVGCIKEGLETWYNCPNCGHEGFKEDCQLTEEGCNECQGDKE